MIRTHVVIYVVRELITLLSGCMFCSGFFATTRKHVRREKPSQNESDIVFFARKRYTVTVNGILVSPSWFCCATNSSFLFIVP